MAARERGPVATVVAVGLLPVYLGGISATTYLEVRAGVSDPSLESALLVIAFSWFVLLGALLTWRQPRNPMGWLFAAIALLIALLPPGSAYVDFRMRDGRPPSTWLALLAWPNNWYWFVLLSLFFVFVPLLFPDGRLPSPRWRPLAWLAGLSTAGMCVVGGLAETVTTQGGRHELVNPLGVAGLQQPEESAVGSVLFIGLIVAVVGAFASLAVRFRRSHGRERLQVKWLLFASGILVVSLFTEPLEDGELEIVGTILTGVAFNAMPLAITIAILRYRLYEIDRIISRTASYLVLTALLLGIYAAGVVGVGGLMRSVGDGQGGTLVVAASTLAVAAAFQPLRRRVQQLVDHRFDRARYDAHRTVESFSRRLRDEVDLDALTDDLHEVVQGALHPAHVSVWLPPGAGR